MIRDQEALEYHIEGRPGKIEVVPTKPCITQRDLSLAYTPGVAVPCRRIHDDRPRRFLQIPRPRIVPKPAPRREQLLFRRGGQRGHVGESLQETLVVRDYRRYAGLLEHDLGNPDPVGIAGPSPGQVALVFVIPGEQATPDGALNPH